MNTRAPIIYRNGLMKFTQGFVGVEERVIFSNPGNVVVREMNSRLLEQKKDGSWKTMSPEHRWEYMNNKIAKERRG